MASFAYNTEDQNEKIKEYVNRCTLCQNQQITQDVNQCTLSVNNFKQVQLPVINQIYRLS